MELIRDSVSLAHLQELAAAMYGDLVKAVVDVKGETMVIGGELHSDEEAMLLDHGADIYARTTAGLMPIDEAERAGASGLVAMLREAAMRASAAPAAARLSTGNP